MKKVLMAALLVLLACFTAAGEAARNSVASDESAILNEGLHMGTGPDIDGIAREAQYAYDNKKYDEALALYRRLTELEPDNETAWLSSGECNLHLKNYAAAVEDYSAAVQLNTASAEAFFKRGVAYYYLTEYRQSIDDEAVVLALQPQHGGAYLIQAVCWQRLGDIAQARATYAKVLENVPTSQRDIRKAASDMLDRLGSGDGED